MTRLSIRIAALVTLCSTGATAQPGTCTPSGALVELPGLREASGLAASRRVPGRLWTHNDSGQPVLFALDSSGAITGQLRVTGAAVEDWEAVTVGPCGSESCIYVADIGDNDAGRRQVTIYRIPEPASAGGSVAASGVFHATYPDGSHDAETLLVANGRLHIVTKGATGPVAVYAFPAQLQAGTTLRLERVAQIAAKADARSRITDGDVSADGKWIVLRSNTTLTFYDAAELLAGRVRPVSTVSVSGVKEPQGEGVAFGARNTLFLAGESGGRGRSGTFTRFPCAVPVGP